MAESMQKLLSEMSISLQQSQSQFQMTIMQIQRKQNNLKLNDLTMEEIKDEAQVWKGVGKAFLKVSKEKYCDELTKENTTLKEDLKNLEIKKNYYETSLNNTIDNMNKMFKQK